MKDDEICGCLPGGRVNNLCLIHGSSSSLTVMGARADLLNQLRARPELAEVGEYQFRYWKRGWRKAVCGACWSIVAKSDVEAHARAHVRDGHQGTSWDHGTDASFLDVTVFRLMSGSMGSKRTGWLTNNTGPR